MKLKIYVLSKIIWTFAKNCLIIISNFNTSDKNIR